MSIFRSLATALLYFLLGGVYGICLTFWINPIKPFGWSDWGVAVGIPVLAIGQAIEDARHRSKQ